MVENEIFKNVTFWEFPLVLVNNLSSVFFFYVKFQMFTFDHIVSFMFISGYYGVKDAPLKICELCPN